MPYWKPKEGKDIKPKNTPKRKPTIADMRLTHIANGMMVICLSRRIDNVISLEKVTTQGVQRAHQTSPEYIDKQEDFRPRPVDILDISRSYPP